MSRAQLTSTVEQNTGGAVSPYVAGKNAFINGAFNVWQRGTSFAGNTYNTYSADRWVASRGTTAGSTFSRQTSGQTGFQYSMRVARDSGNTSTAIIYLSQSLESANSYRFAGQTVTLSFYAKAGANFSAASSQIGIVLASGTGTDENILNNYTGIAYPISSQTATLTTSWQRFTFTGTVGSTATELGFYTTFTPVGTAGAADNYEITGVQLEVGSVATSFSIAGGNIQGELAACQRYYYRTTSGSAYGFFAQGFVNNTSTTNASVAMSLPVTMRVIPTAVDYSNTAVLDSSFSGSSCTLGIETAESTTNAVRLTAIGSGMTANRTAFVRANNNTAAYVGFTSEL